jgi:hypothetical protein
MSSWCLKGRPGRPGRVARALLAAAVPLLLAASLALAPAAAFAQEWYMQPSGSLTVEGDTNLDLEPGTRTRTEGNLLSLGSIFGVATPTSDGLIRPRIEYRDYPEDSQDNRLEGYLDFNGTYRWERSSASVYGSLEHRDEFNAELPSALYDSVNPVSPTAPETGRTLVGGTRDSALAVPSYNYKLSPLLGWGVSGIYQKINYSPNNDYEFVDFDYYYGKAALTWNVSQRDELSFGGFGSKYEATRIDSRATGSGAVIDWDSHLTQLLSLGVSGVYERVDLTEKQPAVIENTSNAWGATVSLAYQNQLNQFRLNGGRLITPSGAGGLYVQNQLKFQYDREMSYRLSFTAAVIALKNHGISANVVGDDRTYVQPLIEAKWAITRTWYVLGGYQYMWEKFQVDPTGAADNRIYLRVGYMGLGRQQ